MSWAKEKEDKSRAMKTPNYMRPKQYLLFIDFQKAFDSVNRRMLLENLANKGVSLKLIKSLQALMIGTTA